MMADVQAGDLVHVKNGSYSDTFWWVRFVWKWDGLDELMPVDCFDSTADIRRGIETVNSDLQTQQSMNVETVGTPVLVAPLRGDESEMGWGQKAEARCKGYFDDRIAHLELTEEAWVKALC